MTLRYVFTDDTGAELDYGEACDTLTRHGLKLQSEPLDEVDLCLGEYPPPFDPLALIDPPGRWNVRLVTAAYPPVVRAEVECDRGERVRAMLQLLAGLEAGIVT